MAEMVIPKELIYENTYIMTPDGYGDGQKFQCASVRKVIVDTLKTRLEGTEYDPHRSAQTSKEVAEIIKDRVKELGYSRYRFIVQVSVGQKLGQAIRLASRCLWDTTTDNCVSEFFENESLFCVAQVYGLYYE